MSSSGSTSYSLLDVKDDRSFWIDATATNLQASGVPASAADTVEHAFFSTGENARLKFVRLDENTIVHPLVAGASGSNQAPNGPHSAHAPGDKWLRLSPVNWLSNPFELRPGDPNHPMRTDPGRIAECAAVIPNASRPEAPALPTHHFATPWMVQKSAMFPPNDIINIYASEAIADAPYNMKPIVTGPFVCRLEPGPKGNSAMRLLVTVEYEAGVEITESVGGTEVHYTTANNGVVFLANDGNPWTVASTSTDSVEMLSSAGGDRGKSDRHVYISRGIMSILYIGDAEGVVKNFSELTDAEISAKTPAPKGNFNNQFGYGSVGLGAPRTYTKRWSSENFVSTPEAPYTGVFTDCAVLNEFLRLSGYGPGYEVYGKYVFSSDEITRAILSTGEPPQPNLDMSKTIEWVKTASAAVRIPQLTSSGTGVKWEKSSTTHEKHALDAAESADAIRCVGDSASIAHDFSDRLFSIGLNESYYQFYNRADLNTGDRSVKVKIGEGSNAVSKTLDVALEAKTWTLLNYGYDDPPPEEVVSVEVAVTSGAAPTYNIFQRKFVSTSAFAPPIVFGHPSHIKRGESGTFFVVGKNLDLGGTGHYFIPAAGVTFTSYAGGTVLKVGYDTNLTGTTGDRTFITTPAGDPLSIVVVETTGDFPSVSKVGNSSGGSLFTHPDSSGTTGEPGYYSGDSVVATVSADLSTYATNGQLSAEIICASRNSNTPKDHLRFATTSSIDGASISTVITEGNSPGVAVVEYTIRDFDTGSGKIDYKFQAPFCIEYGHRNYTKYRPTEVTIGGFDGTDASSISASSERMMVTLYAAKSEDVDPIFGSGTPSTETATKVVPEVAINVYIDLNPSHEADPEHSTEAVFSITVGNVWLPQNRGTYLARVLPLAPQFVGYTIPNFPNSGIPASSSVSNEYVAGFPLDQYGGIPGTKVATKNIKALMATKYLSHDFSGTVENKVNVNFRCREEDVFPNRPSRATGSSSDGNKSLLMWDPLFEGGSPDVLAITRPNGYAIVELTQTISGGTQQGVAAYANTGSYTYTRSIPAPKGKFSTCIYAQQFGPTPAQTLESKTGDPIVSVDDSVAIADALNKEFLNDMSSSASVAGTNSPNDCLLWKGYPLWRNTEARTNRIRGDILDWGRRVYRYARYVEMIVRGMRPPYTGFTTNSKTQKTQSGKPVVQDVTTELATTVSNACVAIWKSVREIITNGIVPHWDILSDVLRTPEADFADSKIQGFDVLYQGANEADNISRSKSDEAGVTHMLVALRFKSATALTTRIGTFTYGGTAMGQATLEKVANMNSDDIAAAVAKEEADTTVGPADKLYKSDLERIVAAAKRAIREAIFVEDVLSTFGQLRYDRSTCDDARSERSVWGGLTSRVDHELWRWAVLVDPANPRKPITQDSETLAGGNFNTARVYRAVQLQNIMAPSALGELDIRFRRTNGFSYYNRHHAAFGYLLYAAAVALKYAGNTSSVFYGSGTSTPIGDDIAAALTSENSYKFARDAAIANDDSVFTVCNAPEPYPLLQVLYDIIGPSCQHEVDAYRNSVVANESTVCAGSVSPPATDAVHRAYPAHRHFDAYFGHSWETGPMVPYQGLNYEAASESVVAYLGAYRLLDAFKDYALARSKTYAPAKNWLPWLRGYMYQPSDYSYMPQTAYAILASELASTVAFRATRQIEAASHPAREQTYDPTNSTTTKGGFPVVASELFKNTFLSRLVTEIRHTGVSRNSLYKPRQMSYNRMPQSILVSIGSTLVPISDLTSYITQPNWARMITGESDRVIVGGVEDILPPEEHQIFDKHGLDLTKGEGNAATNTNFGSLENMPQNVGEWLDRILTQDPLATTENASIGDPYTHPSIEIQRWARFVAASLQYKVFQVQSGTYAKGTSPGYDPSGAIVFPGCVSTPITHFANPPVPQANDQTFQYPDSLNLGAYYLPQSSWFDTLFWYRFSTQQRGCPTPNVAAPFEQCSTGDAGPGAPANPGTLIQ